MKRFACSLALIAALITVVSFRTTLIQQPINGAWRAEQPGIENISVLQDGYFSQAVFDKAGKSFIGTMGGTYEVKGNAITVKVEFDSKDKENVGKTITHTFSIDGNKMTLKAGDHLQQFTRIDDGEGALAGLWRITGRMQNDKMTQMQRGDRKTVKLLSGSRFQWIAINPVSKEFFGTGGGTYTFEKGKYTETIEFFPRDSTRVGASLTFDGTVADDTWNHKGMSSKGDPINEIWTREK